MKQVFLLFFTFLFSVCNAQNQKKDREPFKLDLAVDTEHYYSMEVAKSPYFVKEKILQIYPGEKLFVETEIKGDSIFAMKVVQKNLNPSNTIQIEFVQHAEDKSNISMMLKVINPFNKKLNYNAIMYTPTNQKWEATSIIPIRPYLVNYETWPEAIITIVLDKWRFE